MELTGSNVRELLSYDPESGEFTWRVRPARRTPAGSRAGSVIKKGYRLIGVFGKTYMAHRVAFLWMTGEWPKLQIDHINRDKDDNRWCNLREVDQSTNQENRALARADNKLGILGVHMRDGKYRATIQVRGVRMCLGAFSTPDDAHSAYVAAKRAHHTGCTV